MDAYPRRKADPESAAIEWHDSTLVAVSIRGADVILDLRAIVHRSHGRPGLDAGTVWIQPAAVVLENGHRDGPVPAPPCEVVDGRFETDHSAHDGTAPCPFQSHGQAHLELSLATGDSIRFEADRLSITFTGDPEFLEDFAPESPDE